ncbi:hypothetical protein KJ865_09830, partial [Myxococcota bacterium]|nr:hypothetical protein [Myxococcota bacterium]
MKQKLFFSAVIFLGLFGCHLVLPIADNMEENPSFCGNGALDTGETCDATLLNGASCLTEGFDYGEVACTADCNLDTTGCSYNTEECGDGTRSNTEICDGTDLGGESCTSLGYHGGDLLCDSLCEFDLTSCEAEGICGDNTADIFYDEACDGTDLNNKTCLDFGLRAGTLECNGECQFDTTGCGGRCGDGILQTGEGETCDSTVVPTCLSATGDRFGSTTCNGSCTLDTDCYSVMFYGSTESDAGASLIFDAHGNFYVTGWAGGVIDGQTPPGGWDVFLTKFDSTGTRLWTRIYGSTGMDYGLAIALDSNDNVYVAGQAAGAFNGATYLGGTDVFLMKHGPDGNHFWTRFVGTSSNETIGGLAIDAANRITVACTSEGPVGHVSNIGNTDVYLTRFDTDGNITWTHVYGSSAADSVSDIRTDASGNLYVTGTTGGNFNGQVGQGGTDMFILKTDTSGTTVW